LGWGTAVFPTGKSIIAITNDFPSNFKRKLQLFAANFQKSLGTG
jgi:hypothetical protein